MVGKLWSEVNTTPDDPGPLGSSQERSCYDACPRGERRLGAFPFAPTGQADAPVHPLSGVGI